MADEFDQGLVDESPPELEVQEAAPPPDAPAVIDENERRTWEGRTRAEQEKIATARAGLQQMGWDLDADGRPYQVQQQPAYQAPATDPEPEDFNPYDVGQVRNMIQQEATRIAGQMVGGLMPVIDRSLETSLAQQYNDYNDIKQDTTATLRAMGYQGIAHAQAVNPAHLDIAINAARGKRGSSAPAPPDPNVEAQRQARIAAAAGTGGGQSTQARGNNYGFSTEELAQLANVGVDPAEANEMLETGVATVSFEQMFGGGNK